MTRYAVASLLAALFAIPASAADMPSRKAGLWEIKGNNGNGAAFRQCVDAATDQMMQASAGTAPNAQCSKHNVQKSGATITIDSTCTVAGQTTTSHAVVSGSFDSSYTMTVTSPGDGMPGGALTMTVTATWLGPCAADQKPGDMIMPNGMRINILDMQKRGTPGAAPPLSH
jgi:hypothetical protein